MGNSNQVLRTKSCSIFFEYLKMLLKGALLLLLFAYFGVITEKEAVSVSNETIDDSMVVTGSKIEGHTEKHNNNQDYDEANEKNIEEGKSTGKQGIEVEMRNLEDEIKDDKDDNNPRVTKNEIKGKDYSKGSSLVCCKQDVEKCMVCSDSKIDGCLYMLSKRYSECDATEWSED